MPRILILDDEPQSGESLRACLLHEGYDVKSVTTPEAAIDCGRHWLPWVLIADCMPASPLDGLQVAEAVRAANPNLQTILMTGCPSRELRARAASAQVFSVIERPFSMAEMAAAVRQAAHVARPLLHGQILIVSESRTSRELAATVLAAANHRCQVARTAREAQRLVDEHSDIRFAIFDCTSPSVDWGILAAELRATRPELIVIGSSDGADGEEFADLGIAYFLPRFWSAEDLHELLIERIATCTQCGRALPLRRPLPGDDVRRWACQCGAVYQGVMLDGAPVEAQDHVRTLD